MSVRFAHRMDVEGKRVGDRVIQIFVEWPARYGTVLEVNADVPPTALLIGWDDGRRDWIESENFRSLRIWFITDDVPRREPKPGPLEVQLARFMRDEPETRLA